MDEPEKNPPARKYKWPWFVLAAAILGFLLAFVWMFFAVQKEKSERFDAPPPVTR